MTSRAARATALITAALVLGMAPACTVSITRTTSAAPARTVFASGTVQGRWWAFAAYRSPGGRPAIENRGLFAGGGSDFDGFVVPDDVNPSVWQATASRAGAAERVDAVVGFAPIDAAVVTLRTPDGTLLRTAAVSVHGFRVRFFAFVGPGLSGDRSPDIAVYSESGRHLVARP